MEINVHNVFKNMRYKFFEVDGVYYILEIKPSFWKVLFPLFYWFFPFPVYKVEDEEAIKRIQTPESWSMNKSSLALSAGGFSVLIATLLRGKIDNLTFPMPLYIKVIIVLFTILIVVFIRLYVNRVKQRDMYKKVNVKQLDKMYAKVKPQSFKHFFLMMLSYLFFLSFTVLFYFTFLTEENIFLLLLASASLLVLSLAVNITVREGPTPIKFINK